MALEQTDKVDFISISRQTADVKLTLVDALDWTNERHHLTLLQDKINAYLSFIESGEIDRVYPSGIGRQRLINIVARYKPTAAGLVFLDRIRLLVEGAGFGFHFSVRHDLAKDDEVKE
jgi:hypothetical protein